MRPGQNKRMRGRNNNNNNNNNRKGPNPLTRSYESNGPDVKIRGTAHHIAEKYLQLARDAQTSGDPVAAESYLQHAEHYFRLIASAQQAQLGYNRPADEPDPEETEEDDANAVPDRFSSPVERAQPQPQYTPQPQAERPYNGDRQGGYNGERPAYNNGERTSFNGERHDRQDRNPQDRNFQDRAPQDRNPQDRNGQERSGYEGGRRHDRTGRGQRPYRDQEGRNDQRQDFRNQDYQGERQAPENREGGRSFNGQYRDRPRYPADERQSEAMSPQPEVIPREPQPTPVEAPGLPAFITAPVRLGPSTETSASEPAPEVVPGEPGGDAPEFAPRRRRRPRLAAAEPDEPIAPEAPTPNE